MTPITVELRVADAQGFSERVDTQKSRWTSVPRSDTPSRVFSFRGREVATAIDRTAVDVGHRRGLAGEAHIGNFFQVAGAHATRACVAPTLRTWCRRRRRLHVVEFDLSGILRLNDDVEIGDGEGVRAIWNTLVPRLAIFCRRNVGSCTMVMNGDQGGTPWSARAW